MNRGRYRTAALGCAFLLVLAAPARAQETDTKPPDLAAGEATRARVEALAESFAETAKQWGADAVALQVSMLMNSMRAGAVLATEVRIAGPSSGQGSSYLEIDVDTGIILDAGRGDERERVGRLWAAVVFPALEKLETLELKPSGLELVLRFGLQDFAVMDPPGRADPLGVVEHGVIRYVIKPQLLADFVEGGVDAGSLYEQVVVRVEGDARGDSKRRSP